MVGDTLGTRFGSQTATDLGPGSHPSLRGVFRKEGGYWTVGYGGNTVLLKDARGLGYIAHLLCHPGAEFHVLDLFGGIAGKRWDDRASPSTYRVVGALEDLERSGIHIGGLGDAGEVLDEQAKAAYRHRRHRLSELRAEMEEAKEVGQIARAERVEEEIDVLTRELSRAVGLGGRDRRAASPSEKARQSITKSIKLALERIAHGEATLGGHLSRCIKTGTFCSYRPEPDFHIVWEFAKSDAEQEAQSQEVSDTAEPLRAFNVPAPVSESDTSLEETSPSKPSLAVLPFTNISGDPGQEYLSDGITEDIIVDLSQVSALFVVSRNTVFTFKGKAVEITQIARKLNVRYLLEGSVRKVEKRVRVTAQLIDGMTGGHLWAQRYDREFGDVLALQDDITRSVVAALKIRLLPAESQSITDRSTANADAYEYYLKGRSKFFETWGSTSAMRTARDLFTKAVEIDPTYARAYFGLADCNAFLWINGDLGISYEDLLTVSGKALELAPAMAEAYASRGIALFVGGRTEEADAVFERAIHLDPLLFEAHFFYGINCRNGGDFDRAAALLERAAELRADDFASLTLLANVYELQGHAELSKQTARRSLIRIESTLNQRPDAAEVLGVGAATLVYLGENARAVEWVSRAVAREPSNHTVRYNSACAHAVLGNADTALEHLEYILSQVPRARQWLLKIIKNDPQFDSLRHQADFRSLMNRLEADADAR